jgi:glycosyltransferase involved in cell wall biosynthesis
MRVALLTDGIWPYVLGGMQKHSYYLCKYLALNKVQVDLYHFNQSKYNIQLLEFFTEEERTYIHSKVIDFPKGLNYPGAYILRSYKHSQLIFEALKEQLHQYDFIYTKGFTGWYLIEQKQAGNITCCPIGVKFHGYEMFQKPPNFKIWLQQVLLLRFPVKKISRGADVVFSYGGKITDLIKHIGVSADKIFELPSGVEESVLQSTINPVNGTIKFLFLGRYERRKGIEELNEAIKQLLSQEASIRYEFHFIGPIPQQKRIVDKTIIYHGEVRDKAQLQALIRACDVLLCPSWSEGLPNSILEAMANGLAVLATNVGAINNLVKEETGWLINESRSAAIKLTIDQILLLKESEINTKKQQALNLIRSEFIWEKLILKFCNRFLK